MTKGLLTALAVMLICTVIPVAQVLLAPFGPFLGAYFGIRSVAVDAERPLVAAGPVWLRRRNCFGCNSGGDCRHPDVRSANARQVHHPDVDCGGGIRRLRRRNEHAGRLVSPAENAAGALRAGCGGGLARGRGGPAETVGRGARRQHRRCRRRRGAGGFTLPGFGLRAVGPPPAPAYRLAGGGAGARARPPPRCPASWRQWPDAAIRCW